MNRWWASGYVILGAVCYGSLSTITKLAFQQGFTPAEISSGQVTFGCLVLWFITLPIVNKLRHVSREVIFLITLTGAVWGLTEIFYTICLSKIPASIAVILLFQFTWMTQLIQMIQAKSWLDKNQWFSLGSILLGSLCASGFRTSDLVGLDLLGVALALGSAVSYTASIFISGTVATNIPPLLRSSCSVTGQMLFIYFVFPPTFFFTDALGRGLWVWIGLLGMIGTVATTLAYNKAMPHIDTGLAGVLGSVELPVVLLFSSLLLKENVSLTQWMGVGFILFGIVLTSVKTNKKVISTSN